MREYTDRLYEMVEDEIVDAKVILQSMMYWLSEDEVRRFMEVNELIIDDEEE